MKEEEQTELLDILLNVAGEHARMALLDFKIKALVPTWLLIGEDGEVSIFATPWADDFEKRISKTVVRNTMRKKKTQAYSFLTEAWGVTLKSDEWDHATGRPLEGVTAKDHPRRVEVVIALACTAAEVRSRRWQMVREPSTEALVDLKELPPIESDALPEGWTTQMLKNP